MERLAESIRVKLEFDISERSEYPGAASSQHQLPVIDVNQTEQMNTLTGDLPSTRQMLTTQDDFFSALSNTEQHYDIVRRKRHFYRVNHEQLEEITQLGCCKANVYSLILLTLFLQFIFTSISCFIYNQFSDLQLGLTFISFVASLCLEMTIGRPLIILIFSLVSRR
jgi:hypothetical protein